MIASATAMAPTMSPIVVPDMPFPGFDVVVVGVVVDVVDVLEVVDVLDVLDDVDVLVEVGVVVVVLGCVEEVVEDEDVVVVDVWAWRADISTIGVASTTVRNKANRAHRAVLIPPIITRCCMLSTDPAQSSGSRHLPGPIPFHHAVQGADVIDDLAEEALLLQLDGKGHGRHRRIVCPKVVSMSREVRGHVHREVGR
jgi:hypothetical protein